MRNNTKSSRIVDPSSWGLDTPALRSLLQIAEEYPKVSPKIRRFLTSNAKMFDMLNLDHDRTLPCIMVKKYYNYAKEARRFTGLVPPRVETLIHEWLDCHFMALWREFRRGNFPKRN